MRRTTIRRGFAARLAFSSISFAALSCTPRTAPSPAIDLTAQRAALFETHRAAAARAANGDFVGAVAGLFAPEGFYVAALREYGRGEASVRAWLQRDTLNARSRALWTILRYDVSADGRDGYTYGYLDVIHPAGDTVPGGFQAYWRRNAQGRWQILAMGRSRREKGPTNQLPAWIHFSEGVRGPLTDTVASFESVKRTEVAFSDSSVTDVGAAFSSFAAPDAAKLTGHAYVFGAQAVGDLFRPPPDFFKGIAWHAEWGTVSSSDDLGFDVGPVVQRNPPPGTAATPGGLFFTIWHRQPNGEWKFLVD